MNQILVGSRREECGSVTIRRDSSGIMRLKLHYRERRLHGIFGTKRRGKEQFIEIYRGKREAKMHTCLSKGEVN